jgi:serine/threonine protein kinase
MTIDRDRWRVLEPLLDRALGLSTEEQSAWLDELTISAPDLARDIGALLSGESDADRQGFLVEPLELRLSGLELGAYALERPLGQGGMGSVWLARRIDGRFEGRVAIKLLNLALLTATGQQRFRREGSLLARLTHPGIARLLDAGVSDSGQPYLVLEYVDGRPIDAYAAAHRLDVDQRVRLFLQVLAAVGHAHANLVVHRDLKPNNILVTDDGTVKLLDFGIGKLIDAEGSAEHTTITMEGGRALTPDFAAPEQVRGETITTATDVYSLGTLLYLLVSGRHPTNEGARTAADAVMRVLEVEPPRLKLGDLSTILTKALRKKARDRYQTVAALADDLERYLGHEPVSASRDSVAYRTRKFLRRHRAVATAATLTIAALTTATVFSVREMREAGRQRDAAELDAKRSRTLSEMQDVLAADNRGPDGRPLSTVERIALAERVLTHKFGRDPWLVAEVLATLSGNLNQAGERGAERQMLARARDIARRAGLAQQVALTDCLRVYSFFFDDQFDSARVDLAEAKAALRRAGSSADKEIESICLNGEGQVLISEGHRDAGVALLQRAVALSAADRRGQRVRTSVGLAQALYLSQRLREAAAVERQYLAELDSTGYGDTEVFPNSASFLAETLWELGEPVAADAEIRPFVREQEAIHGQGRISTYLALLYGWGKVRLGELDSADVWIARALRDTTAGGGGMTVWLPMAITELRLEQGRLEDAARASAQLSVASRGRRAVTALLKARIRSERGDPAGALAFLEKELRTLSTDGRAPLPLFAPSFVTAGEWRLAFGDPHAAESLAVLATRAAAVDSLALRRSGLVGRADLLRARALRVLGDTAGARMAIHRAVLSLATGYGPLHSFTLEARALRDSLER